MLIFLLVRVWLQDPVVFTDTELKKAFFGIGFKRDQWAILQLKKNLNRLCMNCVIMKQSK